MLHARCWLCSGGDLLCPPASWFKCHRTLQFPGVSTNTSGQVELEDTLPSEWGCKSAPCLVVGKLGSRVTKFLIWGSELGSLAPSCSLIRLYPCLGSFTEQNHWLRLLLGLQRYELGTKICVLFAQALRTFWVTVRFSVVEPHPSSPWGVSQKQNNP